MLNAWDWRINSKMVLMISDRQDEPRRVLPVAVWSCIMAFVGLTACGTVNDQGVNDPFEAENRSTYELNKTLDRTIVRPLAEGASFIPKPIKQGVANFAGNLDVPTSVVNDLLQAKVGKAVFHIPAMAGDQLIYTVRVEGFQADRKTPPLIRRLTLHTLFGDVAGLFELT